MSKTKVMFFVDGENLSARFQAMISGGRRPLPGVTTEGDKSFLWSSGFTRHSLWQVIRVSYYTTFVGSHDEMNEFSRVIASTRYEFSGGFGFLSPHVFKKEKRGDKVKSVDINLVTDMLRHAFNHSSEEICILSGDGDYLPAIREAMRQGVRVYVGALSSGLNPALKTVADEFYDLDSLCFEPIS